MAGPASDSSDDYDKHLLSEEDVKQAEDGDNSGNIRTCSL